MKKLHVALTTFIMFSCRAINADMDCLDNSHYLDTCVDYKEYYKVETCLCPCEKKYKLLPGRGQCPKCLHYRVPQSFEIIRSRKSHQCL